MLPLTVALAFVVAQATPEGPPPPVTAPPLFAAPAPAADSAAVVTAEPGAGDAPTATELATHNRRARKGLWIGLLAGGGGAFFFSYLLAIVTYQLNESYSNHISGWLQVPVIGPWMSLTDHVLGTPNPVGYVVALGIVQDVGLGAAIAGVILLLRARSLDAEPVDPNPPGWSWTVTPSVGRATTGVMLLGRF